MTIWTFLRGSNTHRFGLISVFFPRLLCSYQSAIYSQRRRGFHTIRGGDDRKEICFVPPFVKPLDLYNDIWTGGRTLSCRAGSLIYRPQPIRDRPVGGVRDFHTVPGYINPGDMHPCLSPCCRSCRYDPVTPVAYEVFLERGIGQFREFESARVYIHTRKISCGDFF